MGRHRKHLVEAVPDRLQGGTAPRDRRRAHPIPRHLRQAERTVLVDRRGQHRGEHGGLRRSTRHRCRTRRQAAGGTGLHQLRHLLALRARGQLRRPSRLPPQALGPGQGVNVNFSVGDRTLFRHNDPTTGESLASYFAPFAGTQIPYRQTPNRSDSCAAATRCVATTAARTGTGRCSTARQSRRVQSTSRSRSTQTAHRRKDPGCKLDSTTSASPAA